MFILVCSAFALGCSDELYHDLDERSANELVAALRDAGIDAWKQPGTKQRYTVAVPPGTIAEAVTALSTRGLPRPSVQGIDSFYPRDSLVPSASEERALLQYTRGQELRRALLAIEGVVDAHVNLALSAPPRYPTSPAPPASASVVIRWRGAVAPVSVEEVQRVVASGVTGVAASDVDVLLSQHRADSGRPTLPRIESLGPLAVASSSRRIAELVLGAMASSILVLGAAVVALLRRRSEA